MFRIVALKKSWILGVFLFLMSSTTSFCQYSLPQNNVWAFGYHCGLDFNGNNAPTAITTAINAHSDTSTIYGEANASVCDNDGHLLFYTNGSRVWDRTNAVMPGSVNSLHGMGDSVDMLTTSTSNGAVIVPTPGRNDQYYLFSLTGVEPMATSKVCKLYYSVIDMDLNNGYGDIVPSKKWILLDSLLTEKMVAVQGTCGRIWLIVHARDTTAFKAYEISSTGLNTQPVISYAGTYKNLPVGIQGVSVNMSYILGQMVASPGGGRLAAAYSNGGVAAVYDFDGASGVVSNELVLDSLANFWYGAAFSPSGKMVYFSNYGPQDSVHSMIYQFNLGLSSNQAIRNSKYKVGAQASAQLRLGPNGRIYFRGLHWGAFENLGQITDPNNPGSACGYSTPGILVSSSANANIGQGFLGFGASIVRVNLPPSGINRVHIDSISCLDTNFTLTAPGNARSYFWDDESDSQQRVIHLAGTYWVRSVHDCVFDMDTFKVYYYDANDLQFDLGNDTIVCNTGRLLLSGPDVTGAAYTWQDSSRERQYLVEESGRYTLKVKKGNCRAADSVKVTLVNVIPDLGDDSVFCLADPIHLDLEVNASPDATVLWNNGSSFNDLVVNDTGTFYVTLSELGCTGSDTIRIGKRLCDCRIYFPNSFSPNGDGRNDAFQPYMNHCPLEKYQLSVYNRYGQKVFETTDPESGWDGTLKGVPLNLGTYFFYARYLPAGSVSKWRYIHGDLTLIR